LVRRAGFQLLKPLLQRAIRACCLMISLRYSTVFMFYLGATQAPFGDGLWASPLQSLWRD